MTTFQKLLIIILIIFGVLFLYILKTGIEFHACITGVNARVAQARCGEVVKTGFGAVGN